MDAELLSTELRTLSSESQAAEAMWITQPEDHTEPAGQVLGEQREQGDLGGRLISGPLFIP